MKILYSIKVKELKKTYKAFGTDITRLTKGIDKFDLYEYKNGLRLWKPQVEGDSLFYSDLAKNNKWYYSKNKDEFDIAIKYLHGNSILEIGCGEGYFSNKVKGMAYTGIELNEQAVIKAKAMGNNVLQKDFSEFACNNHLSFDNVCSFEVLEHLANPEEYFISSNKVLKKGGILITAVPSEDSFMGTLHESCLNAPPHHLSKWTDKCLRNFPNNFGFECLDLIHIPVEEQHYQWFWIILLTKVITKNKNSLNLFDKFKLKLALIFLKILGIGNYVPKEFNIPGHTIVAIHKKIFNI